MMTKFHTDAAIKAVQWERTKGELRALQALQGSYSGDPRQLAKWQDLRVAIDNFILIVEANGLAE